MIFHKIGTYRETFAYVGTDSGLTLKAVETGRIVQIGYEFLPESPISPEWGLRNASRRTGGSEWRKRLD